MSGIALLAGIFFFSSVMTSCDDDENINYTVTFNSNGGTEVASQTVKGGEKATEPRDPTRSGHTFDAWYKEAAFTNLWRFNTDVVNENITLHAKWNVEQSNDPGGNNDNTGSNATFNGVISANVVDGTLLNPVVNIVRFSFIDQNDCEPRTLASGSFSAGSFSITLPEIVPNSFLDNVLDALYATNLTISDDNARMALGPLGQCGEFGLVAIGHSGDEIGEFYLTDSDFVNFGLIVYVDRDVTVNGSENDLVWDNVKFTKGWNMIYMNPMYGGRIATTAPSGLRWRYESYYD